MGSTNFQVFGPSSTNTESDANYTTDPLRVNGIPSGQVASTTGTLTSGSPNVTLASGTGVAAGQTIVGTGVPSGTTVSSISGTSLVMSANATANGSGVALSFYGGTIWPSISANKTLYQATVGIYAIAKSMAQKGYTVSDSSVSTLVTAMGNLVTFADLPSSLVTVSYATSISFPKAGGYDLTLTGNVTSSNFAVPPATGSLVFCISQNSTGGYTFAPPTSIVTPSGSVTLIGFGNVCSLPNSTSIQEFLVRPSGVIEATGPMIWLSSSGIIAQPTTVVQTQTTSGTIAARVAPVLIELCNATSGAITRTLWVGTAQDAGLRVTNVKTDSSTNGVTFAAGSGQTIIGGPNIVNLQQWQSFSAVFDGVSNWILD